MREIDLRVPLSEANVRELKIGDRVRLSGQIVTARDRAHRYLVEEAQPDDLPFDLANGVVYHCGPIVRRDTDGTVALVAAGPTTSARMNLYVAPLIGKFGVRAIIGKGGLDDAVLDTFVAAGAVYLSAVGGAAQVLAGTVDKIAASFKTDAFGDPEGMWVLHVSDFPAVVTMDAHGHSLHREIADVSMRNLASIVEGSRR